MPSSASTAAPLLARQLRLTQSAPSHCFPTREGHLVFSLLSQPAGATKFSCIHSRCFSSVLFVSCNFLNVKTITQNQIRHFSGGLQNLRRLDDHFALHLWCSRGPSCGQEETWNSCKVRVECFKAAVSPLIATMLLDEAAGPVFSN
ncbi:hypothetical protein NDU88_011567 [Pleurodeles waltl]|uniref:Uncharacterized protein n=1 Tax=Pleurodeles waltl TaxID=8319 RepID=A0AAV7S3Y9_PLEWA|nr:hypothetical protein NDU88_011567 [Pleurodeles waltl]